MTTQNQATKAPVRKLNAAALGGSLAAIAMGAIAVFYPEAYERVPAGFEGGLATAAAFVMGYMVKERA